MFIKILDIVFSGKPVKCAQEFLLLVIQVKDVLDILAYDYSFVNFLNKVNCIWSVYLALTRAKVYSKCLNKK